MADEVKVLKFPTRRPRRLITMSSDEELVNNVRKAWRKLARTIRAAREAGLQVETDFYEHREPTFTRKL